MSAGVRSGTDAKEFLWQVRVYHEDTDSEGIVYYANYLRFMERARTEWLRSLGVEQGRLRREASAMFTVARFEIDYRAPARFDDELAVAVHLLEIGRASLWLAQDVRLLDGAASRERLICEARVRVACVDAHTLRPRAIPQGVLEGPLRGTLNGVRQPGSQT